MWLDRAVKGDSLFAATRAIRYIKIDSVHADRENGGGVLTLFGRQILVVDTARAVSFRMIPDFREDGYLPEGLHLAGDAEITFRFGASTLQRRRLILRLRRWIALARIIQAKRLFIDGSFVTNQAEPNDVDAVIWLPENFTRRVSRGDIEAVELETMLVMRRPEELFAAEDRRDWDDWLEFFSRTRESDGRRKGLVEVEL